MDQPKNTGVDKMSRELFYFFKPDFYALWEKSHVQSKIGI